MGISRRQLDAESCGDILVRVLVGGVEPAAAGNGDVAKTARFLVRTRTWCWADRQGQAPASIGENRDAHADVPLLPGWECAGKIDQPLAVDDVGLLRRPLGLLDRAVKVAR